jgi:hypothetical protein
MIQRIQKLIRGYNQLDGFEIIAGNGCIEFRLNKDYQDPRIISRAWLFLARVLQTNYTHRVEFCGGKPFIKI